MLPRILSHLIFWPLMAVLIAGATVVVFGVYLPFVALKAIVLGITGKIGDATGRKKPEPPTAQEGPVRLPG